METKKYKLTEEIIKVDDSILYRIEALRDFNGVKKGDKGGFVEKEDNLSQSGNCWVYDDAKVYGNAKIYDNATVYGMAQVYGNALVYGNTKVYGSAIVYDNAIVRDNTKVRGNAIVSGNTEICGDAVITSISDYIVFKNWWSSGRHFTWTRSNDMWKVGCFYGTGQKLIEKAYKDSKKSGKEYERIVKYIESSIADDTVDA